MVLGMQKRNARFELFPHKNMKKHAGIQITLVSHILTFC